MKQGMPNQWSRLAVSGSVINPGVGADEAGGVVQDSPNSLGSTDGPEDSILHPGDIWAARIFVQFPVFFPEAVKHSRCIPKGQNKTEVLPRDGVVFIANSSLRSPSLLPQQGSITLLSFREWPLSCYV